MLDALGLGALAQEAGGEVQARDGAAGEGRRGRWAQEFIALGLRDGEHDLEPVKDKLRKQMRAVLRCVNFLEQRTAALAAALASFIWTCVQDEAGDGAVEITALMKPDDAAAARNLLIQLRMLVNLISLPRRR